MDLNYLLSVLWRKKWLILITGLVAGIAAYFFTQSLKPVYSSNAQVSTGFTLTDEIAAADNSRPSSAFEVGIKFSNAIEVFLSPIVLSQLTYGLVEREIANKVPGASDWAPYASYIQQKKEKFEILNASEPKDKSILLLAQARGIDLESLRSKLSVNRVMQSDFINIGATAEDPQVAAFMANNLIEAFVSYNNSLLSSRTEESVELLDSLVKQNKLEMDTKMSALNSFKTSMGLLNSTSQGGSTLDMIRQFETELVNERNNLRRLKLSLADVEDRLAQLKTGTGSTLNSEIVSIRNRIRALEEQYRNNPSDALQKQIADLRNDYDTKLAQVQTVGKGGVTPEELQERKSEYTISISSSEQKLQALQAKVGELKGDTRSLATSYATEEGLQREARQAEEEYNKALNRYNGAMVKKAGFSGTVVQTIRAQPAMQPNPSKRWAIVGLSAVGLMGMVVAGILVMTFLDSSIRSPSSFARITGLRPIAVINHTTIGGTPIADLVEKAGPGRDNSFREALRKLRFAIENSGKRSILFTSTDPGQGKTTLIQALAFSFQLSNKKVLVLDTNFCNNDLTVQLGAEPTLEKISFATAGVGETELSRYVSRKGPFVDVIGCTGGDYTPMEILPKNNLLTRMEDLKKIYDYILVEGAPLNQFTDSKELAQYVDGIVCVFSAENNIRHEDEVSFEFIKEHEAKFIGAILNKVNQDNMNL